MTSFSAFRTVSLLLRCRPMFRNPRVPLLDTSSYYTVRVKSTNAGKYLINEAIPYRVVQLVNPETEKLEEPTALADVLASIDHKTHFVQLVNTEPAPLVKIVDKKEAYEKHKASKAKAKTATKPSVKKEIQMTWGVAEGDFEHKLKKVRQELEKGNRVDLVFAPKKGQPYPKAPEMEARVEKTCNTLADVGKEWKPRELRKAITVIFFQSIRTKEAKAS